MGTPRLATTRLVFGLLLGGPGLLGGAGRPAAAQPATPPEVVFRSDVLERTNGQPNTYQIPFAACDPAGSYRLILENGSGGAQRVSSAAIWLNGTEVVSTLDLNQQVAEVVRPVTLGTANTLEVRLAGGPGGRLRITVEGYAQCFRVRFTAPLAGSVLHEPTMLVEGEIRALGAVGLRLRTTIILNGRVLDWFLPVQVNGRRFAAAVPLAPGENRLVAIATDGLGRAVEDAVTLTFDPDPPEYTRAPRPDVSPTVGFAPLAVTFGGGAASNPDVDLLNLDVDGDGQPDYRLADFAPPPHRVTHTYATEGLHLATMVVRDGVSGYSLTQRVPINVVPVPDLVGLWDAFRAALARGDVDAAVRLVAGEAAERYRTAFQDLGADLPGVGAALQAITPQVVNPGYATASTTRIRDGVTEGFLVHFVRDADGVWRIASL